MEVEKKEEVAQPVEAATAVAAVKEEAVHEGRIIIRNLGFDIKDQHLQKEFAKYGKITGINIPIKNENNLNRGFGFIEYATKEEAKKAIDSQNGKKFKGRTVVLEFSQPKKKYETKVSNIMEHSNRTREDIVQPKQIKEEREEFKKAKEEKKQKYDKVKEDKKKEYEQKRLKDIQDNKVKEQAKTLFVRNIGYDTTQEDFKDFMEKFGGLRYAVLVKQRDIQGAGDGAPGHKGTGFVLFKDPKAAEQLIEMSKSIETKLDDECRNQRLKVKRGEKVSDTKGVVGIIQSELELKGRRLVIMEAMTKGDAKTHQEEDKKNKNAKEDKRNLNFKKEGLLNEAEWVHKKPAPSAKNIEQRQHLLNEKEQSLSKNSNLFVSKTRLTLRNLPKREFMEQELKELMLMVVDEWLKLNPEQNKNLNKKKFLKQVKILRDKEKTDTTSGDKLASGIGFAEFSEEDLSLFAVRYLNNMELVSGKGLIVDFSCEDARQLHKRQKRLDRQKKVNDDKKREVKQSQKKETQDLTGVVVDLGKKDTKKKDEVIPIDKIRDLEVLHKLNRETNSRGKKQRIKKRIAFLEGKSLEKKKPAKPVVSTTAAVVEPEVVKAKAPKEKIQEILKKRDEKLKRKEDKKSPLFGLTEEDKQIMKKVKGHKKETKRQKSRETDQFDDIFANYKKKVLKRVKKGETNKEEGGAAFEEVEMSDY